MTQSALLIIDLQKGVDSLNGGLYQLEQVLSGVNRRIQSHRKKQNPILFIQHTDEMFVLNSNLWQLFDCLTYHPEDYYLTKTHANAFYQTSLQSLLQELSVTHLEICGAQTEYCVDTTVRMAHGLGYTCTMQRGLTTTSNSPLLDAKTIIMHHEHVWDQRFLSFI